MSGDPVSDEQLITSYKNEVIDIIKYKNSKSYEKMKDEFKKDIPKEWKEMIKSEISKIIEENINTLNDIKPEMIVGQIREIAHSSLPSELGDKIKNDIRDILAKYYVQSNSKQ